MHKNSNYNKIEAMYSNNNDYDEKQIKYEERLSEISPRNNNYIKDLNDKNYTNKKYYNYKRSRSNSQIMNSNKYYEKNNLKNRISREREYSDSYKNKTSKNYEENKHKNNVSKYDNREDRYTYNSGYDRRQPYPNSYGNDDYERYYDKRNDLRKYSNNSYDKESYDRHNKYKQINNKRDYRRDSRDYNRHIKDYERNKHYKIKSYREYSKDRRYYDDKNLSCDRYYKDKYKKEEDINEYLIDENLCILVYQINYNAKEKDVFNFFTKSDLKGNIIDIRFIRDKVSKKFKGTAIIEFENKLAVENAIKLDNEVLLEQNLVIRPGKFNVSKLFKASKLKPKDNKNDLYLNHNSNYIQSNDFYDSENYKLMNVNPYEESVLDKIAAQYDVDVKQTKIYVAGYNPSKINKNELTLIFKSYGSIDSINQTNDDFVSIITYSNKVSAQVTIDKMNNFNYKGSVFKIANEENSNSIIEYANKVKQDAEIEELKAIKSNNENKDDNNTIKSLNVNNNSNNNLSLKQKDNYTNNINIADPLGLNQIGSPCVTISNVFVKSQENNSEFFNKLKEDIMEVLNKYGEVVDIWINKSSEKGDVWAKFKTYDQANTFKNEVDGTCFKDRKLKCLIVTQELYDMYTF